MDLEYAVGEERNTGEPLLSFGRVRHYAPAVALLVVGLMVTLAGYRVVSRYEETAAHLRFEQAAREKIALFETRIGDQVSQLEAALALFESSELVERHEFATFVRGLLSRSDLDAVEWVPRVAADERHAFETNSSEGRTITEWSDGGTRVRAGSRDEYFPVQFAEPRPSNDAALGFDLGSEPTRSSALEAARDTGQLAVAGPITPVQYPSATNSFLLVLPHYRSSAATVEGRRQALEGFVVGLLELRKVLHRATAHSKPSHLAWFVRDGSRSVLGPEHETSATGVAPAHRLEAAVQLGPRMLTVEAISIETYRDGYPAALPLLAVVVGAAFTILSAAYLSWLVTVISRQRAMQDALRSTQHRYRTLVEQAPEAIYVIDTETMRFVDANPAAETLLQLTHNEYLELGLVEISAPVQPDRRLAADVAPALIRRALASESVSFDWVLRDSKGNDVFCDVRLRRLPDGVGNLVRGSMIDVSERHRSEQRRRELLRELDHRVKNCFATVLALAQQSAESTITSGDFHSAFNGRVHAMARAHEALAAREWKGASVRDLVQLVLGAYYPSPDGRIRTSGPPATLAPQAASAISMLLHELATNAAKYGALSVSEGHVELRWTPLDDGSLRFDWREHGGPAPREIRPTGFGTRLIRGLVEHELGGTLDIERRCDGLAYRITLPPEHVTAVAREAGDEDGRSGAASDSGLHEVDA